MHKPPLSPLLISGLALSLGLAAGPAAAATSADLVGKDSSDNDQTASSVGPFNYGTMKADLAPLTLASDNLTAAGGRTVGFSDSAEIASGATVTVTLTNGKVDSATDQSYYLAKIDSGAGGAGTIDAVATDVVSGAAVLSAGDSVLTFTTTAAIAADAQVVVVRSKDAASSSAHSYSDGNTAQTPTWIINQDATGDFTAAITGTSTTGFALIARAAAPLLDPKFTAVTETIDVSDTKYLSSYVRSESRLICAEPKNTASGQSYDDADATLPAMQLGIADSVTTNDLAYSKTGIDAGKITNWTDFTAGQVSVTSTIHGAMAAVSSIHWDLDNSGTFDADEKFTLDTANNKATLTWDPADSSNDAVYSAKRQVKIVFNGTTALTPGVYYATHSATSGGVTATTKGAFNIGRLGGDFGSDQGLCIVSGYKGARFRPNYLWSGRDVYEQFVRIGVDLSGGMATGDEIGKTSFDVYARAKQISGDNFVKMGSVPASGELLLWGYEVRTKMVDAGYTASSVAQRMDVDFVVEGLGTNYLYDTTKYDTLKAFKLNVVSIQRSPRGSRVIPVRAVRQDASSNDVVVTQ